MYDVIVIGSGPAGLSAAINVRQRGKTVLVVSNNRAESFLYKTEQIGNYLGLPIMSGKEMVERFFAHAEKAGVEIREGRVVGVLPFGDDFMVNVGPDVIDTHAVVLALGAVPPKHIPGEEEYLGHGVSYCATCDGMLYRGKSVVVFGGTADSVHETNFLNHIGCKVTFVSSKPVESLDDAISAKLVTGKLSVEGDGTNVSAFNVGDERIECAGIFLLRPAISAGSLLPGLEMEGAFIRVGANMDTNVPGVYAAGDCVGKPLQVAKAVGEGQIAGLAACEAIESRV